MVCNKLTVWVLATVTASFMLSSLPAAAQDNAKWFVLRNKESGTCDIQRLIMMGGDYAAGGRHKAGGPYASQTDALQRLQTLQDRAVCAKG